MTKGYNVYKNDRFIQFIDGRSKEARRKYIKYGAVIGTHMGEWSRYLSACPVSGKHAFEYEYATTTGAYFRFIPAARG